MTRSADEWLMSRSCQSATFSSAVTAWPRISRARPHTRSREFGVALVGHRRGAGLPLAEELLHLPHLRALQAAYLRGELLQGGGDDGERRNELGVAVALHDLVGQRRDGESQGGARVLLHLGGDGGVAAHGARRLADGDLGAGIGEALAVAEHLLAPQRQFEAEGDGFGVDAVGAPHLKGVLELDGALAQYVDEAVCVGEQDRARVAQLHAERGVLHVVGGEAEVDPSAPRRRGWARSTRGRS